MKNYFISIANSNWLSSQHPFSLVSFSRASNYIWEFKWFREAAFAIGSVGAQSIRISYVLPKLFISGVAGGLSSSSLSESQNFCCECWDKDAPAFFLDVKDEVHDWENCRETRVKMKLGQR